MDFYLTIAILVTIYWLLAMSFNLLMGYSGLFSIGHAIIYGLGAYTSAILSLELSIPVILSIPVGAFTAAFLSAAVAFPALRVTDEYLAILTIALQIAGLRLIMNVDITGGPSGLPGMAYPSIPLLGDIDSGIKYLLFALLLCLLAMFCIRRLVRSPFGRAIQGVKDDELATTSLGISVTWTKVKVFFLSGLIAGLAGGVYAHYFAYIAPESFDVDISLLIIAMVVVGGAATMLGPFFGAFILVGLPEALRFADLPTHVAGPTKQLIYVLVVFGFLFLRPQGIAGKRASSLRTADSTPESNESAPDMVEEVRG